MKVNPDRNIFSINVKFKLTSIFYNMRFGASLTNKFKKTS